MIMPSNLEKCTSEKLSDEAVETLVDEAATHDASASAEVVVGPKICLYGVETAGLRASGAAAGLAGSKVFAWGVAIWVAW
jgi:hypothetical protein